MNTKVPGKCLPVLTGGNKREHWKIFNYENSLFAWNIRSYVFIWPADLKSEEDFYNLQIVNYEDNVVNCAITVGLF